MNKNIFKKNSWTKDQKHKDPAINFIIKKLWDQDKTINNLRLDLACTRDKCAWRSHHQWSMAPLLPPPRSSSRQELLSPQQSSQQSEFDYQPPSSLLLSSPLPLESLFDQESWREGQPEKTGMEQKSKRLGRVGSKWLSIEIQSMLEELELSPEENRSYNKPGSKPISISRER